MRLARCTTLALLSLTAAILCPASGDEAAAKPKIVTNGIPFSVDKNEAKPGGHSAPVLTYWDYSGGFAATWLNYASASDRHVFVRFFSSGGAPYYPTSQMGASGGPTAGNGSVSAAPVSFADGTSLVLFSADRSGASASAKRDVFAQKMGKPPILPIGDSISVNQDRANAQDSILATRLSNGKVLAVFVSHANAASSHDIRGRVVNADGGGSASERALTVNTAGAQQPTSLASLGSGRSVLAYVVKDGQKQQVFVQRFDSAGKRIGAPKLLKTTQGSATYGGAGVAGLSNGRFLALWFVAAANGKASLKGRIFAVDGTPGDLRTIGQSSIPKNALTIPKIAVAPEGQIVVATDGVSNGHYSIDAWLLTPSAAPVLGPVKLVTSNHALAAESLVRADDADYFVSWTQAAGQPTATLAMLQRFNVTDCGRC